MPITIQVPTPSSVIGPGVQLAVSSSFIGPLPTGSHFLVTINLDADMTQHVFEATIPTDIGVKFWTIGVNEQGYLTQFRVDGIVLPIGATAYVKAQLFQDATTVVDTGTATFEWQPTVAIDEYINLRLLELGSTIGQFTTTDRAQLAAVATDTTDLVAQTTGIITTSTGQIAARLSDFLSGFTLDALTLVAFAGECTGDPVTYDLSNIWCFGVIVRICTFPEWVEHLTPDHDWTRPDLAVLTIRRGTDSVKRIPIHGSGHMEYPLPGFSGPIPQLVLSGLQPPLTSIEVDWMPGVTGTVWGMKFP